MNYEDLISLPSGDRWFINNYSRVLDSNGSVIGIQVISHEITELKEKELRISHLSYHDELTGLYNRRFFYEQLNCLDTSRNRPLSIAVGDVNGLKLVNDAFGHQLGDQLLVNVAKILRKSCRQEDIIARIGGDEFAILLPKTDKIEAAKIINRINMLVAKDKIGPLGFSIAISSETKYDDEDAKLIIKKAEDRMYREKINDNKSSRGRTLHLILKTFYLKNRHEPKHSKNVSKIGVEIGNAMGLDKDEINHIKLVGLMHDIGKIGIAENVLNSTKQFSEEEQQEIRKHSEIGFRILNSIPEFLNISEDVFSHHERWDGEGYPRGLKGESISIYARIISIADAFDAMVSERLYRKDRQLFQLEEAIQEIKINAGSQFDPAIAKIFVEKVLNEKWDV